MLVFRNLDVKNETDFEVHDEEDIVSEKIEDQYNDDLD
jgi:hypothetical protein